MTDLDIVIAAAEDVRGKLLPLASSPETSQIVRICVEAFEGFTKALIERQAREMPR